MQSRREFLTALMLSGAPAVPVSFLAMSQLPLPTEQNPQKEKDDTDSGPKFNAKSALEASRKDIKKDVGKLFQLASELKNEVEKVDSVQVLSLAMVKKAEEIEKLAKQIRSRAIG